MPQNSFELIQTILLRNGFEELLLTKRTDPDQSHSYALSQSVKGVACWYRCMLAGNGLESGDQEPGQFPPEHLPDDVTLDVAAGRAPAKAPLTNAAADRSHKSTAQGALGVARKVTRAPVAKIVAARTVKTPVGVSIPRPRKIDFAVLAVLSQATTEGNLRGTAALHHVRGCEIPDRQTVEAVWRIRRRPGR